MITIEELIQKLELEFDAITPGTLKPESVLRESVEWNSVNALILIAMINTEYDIILNAEDLRSIVTVNDIFQIIKMRMTK
jgi:acyl carrier protein